MSGGKRHFNALAGASIDVPIDSRGECCSPIAASTPSYVFIAAAQRGLITRAQLVGAGLSHQQVDRRLRDGSLHRVHRGVYALGHPSLPPFGPEQAALLASGGHAVLSHATAAAVHELLPAGGEPVALIHPPPFRRSRPGIRLHRVSSLPRSDVHVRLGLRVTTPARTLEDLARARHPDVSLALNEALVRRLVHPEQLTHSHLRALLRAGVTPTRSAAERRLLALVAAARLPRPEANVRVGGHVVDAFWRAERLAVEVDGYASHHTRAAFERDRRRDAELLATSGVVTMRITWRQLTSEREAVVARLAAALAGR